MATVTFVNVPSRKNAVLSIYPPVGILSMCACLKENGYVARFIDADLRRLSPEDAARLIAMDPPQIVGFTLNVGQVAFALEYIEAIQREFSAIPVVIGGPYVSGVGRDIFCDFPTVAYAVIGEGEFAIVDLVECLEGKKELKDVRNLLFQRDGMVHQNASERIADLDSLPLPDYSLITDYFDRYTAPYPSIASPSMLIMCTRGCPYACSFCSSPVTWDRKVTFRSTDSVIKEIKLLKEMFDVKEIFFQDDTLNARPAWFTELCDKIIEHGLHRGIYYKCAFRANRNLVTMELLQKAKAANVWMIFYGVESGNQDILRAMKKQVTLDEIRHAFRLTREAGIYSYASMMIGNSGETSATVQDSLTLLDEIQPDFGEFAIAAPFPGSELYAVALKKGHITQTDFKKYIFGDCILRTDQLTTSDIVALEKKANAHFGNLRNTVGAQRKLEVETLAVGVKVDSFPAPMHKHQKTSVYITVTNNTGERFTSMPPYPINVAYHWKNIQGDYAVYNGQRTIFQVPLLPAESRPVKMNVDAPDQPGKYLLEISLVQEDCFWFEQHLEYLPVKVEVDVV
ncbi:MAG: radical SAM protein [Deltaproteobacteria bacterium]|nr:MAG: radical SAM protein [Deltaproteobacteria bacterium]